MKLGVFAVLFGDKSLEEALDYIAESGLETVEIGTGGFPGDRYCNPQNLLEDESRLNHFKQAVESRGLQISALSCHGNPLHPNSEIAQRAHENFEQTVRLAAKLGVETVITFSGCPGESEHSQNPVWVTCPWPEEFASVLEWQWEEKVIPYWKEQNQFLKQQGVRVAIEPHPGFVVYNTETMLRLRKQCGDQIGVNFDPSHLFWQQMDPVLAIKELSQAGPQLPWAVMAFATAARRHPTALRGVRRGARRAAPPDPGARRRQPGLAAPASGPGRPLPLRRVRQPWGRPVRSPSGPYDLEVMAEDALAVLDAAGVAWAHVMGASMGGILAQMIAGARSLTWIRSLCAHPGAEAR